MLVKIFPHAPDKDPGCMARAVYREGEFCKVCGYRLSAHRKAQSVHGLLKPQR